VCYVVGGDAGLLTGVDAMLEAPRAQRLRRHAGVAEQLVIAA
jgi:hypothetical protein